MKLSLLHDRYRRGDLLQGRIMSINKTTGIISVFIRNGLTTSATYLYDINDLRVGMVVLIGVVSGAYVILNRLANTPIGRSYSMSAPVTPVTTPYLFAADGSAIWKFDPSDLSVLDTIEGPDPGWYVIGAVSNPTTRKVYFCGPSAIWELDVDSFTFRQMAIAGVTEPYCLTIDKINNILYFYHYGYKFFKVDPTTDSVISSFTASAPTYLGGPASTLSYDPHNDVLIGVSEREYRYSEIIKITCNPFAWVGSWSLNTYGPLKDPYSRYYGSAVDEADGGKAYICIPIGYGSPYPNYSGVYKLDISSGMTIEDYVIWPTATYGDAQALSMNGSKLYIGLNFGSSGGFAEIDLSTFSQIDRFLETSFVAGYWTVPQQASFDDDYAYVACWSDDGCIIKVDLDTFLPVGDPWYASAGEYLWLYGCVLM